MKKIIVYGIMFLILISITYARITAIQEQGVEKTYVEDGIFYTINAIYIHNGMVRFVVNNETSDLRGQYGSFTFSDKSIIFVREILEEEVLEAPDMVSFKFWPGKCATPYCKFVEKVEEIPEVAEEIEEVPEVAEEIEEAVPAEEEVEVEEEPEEEVIVPKKNIFERFINWILSWFR